MRDTTYMPRTVSGPGDAEVFTVIYDFVPTGYRRAENGRLSKPTGTAATGTWKAYRARPDGTLEIIRGSGMFRRHVEEAIEEALAA
ncbi:MAG: hypothetical protein JO055_14950 [Alphaproteobacteria bacterium]|nr:hypothetical protein [Alphaproteobacteria bacterium]